MSRNEFSVKTRKAAYDRANGLCECGCGMPIGRERVEYDHELPDFLGGTNDLENCVVMRASCHRRKTNNDMKVISKTRRVRNKMRGHTAAKNKIPGSRGTGIRKPINGPAYRVKE